MPRITVDVPLVLRGGGPALVVQIAEGIRDLVISGVLHAGDRLPASRELASRLGVSRGTVMVGIDQLVAEGYLTARRGSGTFVNPDAISVHPTPTSPPPARLTRVSTDTPVLVDLRPGRPDVRSVADSSWRAAWRQAAAAPSASQPPAEGLPALRTELAAHLRQLRGAVVDPAHIVVTGGARDGLATVLRVLTTQRARPLTVAVEDPGYPSLRQVPLELGATVVEIGVDHSGLRVAPLAAAHPDVVIVTPSHQYPLGASMPITRRIELLGWAADTGGVVIEDDYDSELRYVGAPLPALAALDRRSDPAGRSVVTLGSFSKTVTPAVGAGFLVVPESLRDNVIAHRSALGQQLSGIVQQALADYLAGGGLSRHTERMRRAYRRRRAMVATAFASLADVTIRPMDGGLHAVIEWTVADAALRERETVEVLAAQGIRVGTLSGYWSNSGAAGPPRFGLVIGYGAPQQTQLEPAMLAIATAIAPGPP